LSLAFNIIFRIGIVCRDTVEFHIRSNIHSGLNLPLFYLTGVVLLCLQTGAHPAWRCTTLQPREEKRVKQFQVCFFFKGMILIPLTAAQFPNGLKKFPKLTISFPGNSDSPYAQFGSWQFFLELVPFVRFFATAAFANKGSKLEWRSTWSSI
jgi:hypothetical protein